MLVDGQVGNVSVGFVFLLLSLSVIVGAINIMIQFEGHATMGQSTTIICNHYH